ncbi:MAG: TOBE domain-containing protein, partial [Balneolaceae bacterium]
LGRTNLFEVIAGGGNEIETNIGSVKLDCNACGRVVCSMRPEHLTIEKPNGASSEKVGLIIGREFKGHDITYHVLFKGDQYIVHTDNRILFDPDDKVVLKALEPAVVLQEKIL